MTVAATYPRQLLDRVRGFAAKHLDYDVVAADRAARFPRSAWQACADFGIQGLPVPVELGEQGADPLATALVLEELGAACRDNGLLFTLGAQMWSCEIPLLLFGTDELKHRYLPGLCDGRLVGAHAMSEPDTGSDAPSLSTTATPADGGFVAERSQDLGHQRHLRRRLHRVRPCRRRTWVRGHLRLCRRGVLGRRGGRRAAGEGGDAHRADGRGTAEGLLGPADAMLGGRGGGMVIFHRSMEWERSLILATVVGTMARQLDDCAAFAQARRRFGQPIADLQAVAHKLADMRVRLQTARLMVHEVARQKTAGVHDHGAAAMVKLHLSESFVRSCADTLTLHAATGYQAGGDAERNLRDAYATLTYSGPSEIQRNLIANGLTA